MSCVVNGVRFTEPLPNNADMVTALHTRFADVVAANIRAETGRRGMHQRDIARHLGLAPSRISERWRGITAWSLDDIDRLAELFSITPQQLCAEIHAPTAPRPTRVELGLGLD